MFKTKKISFKKSYGKKLKSRRKSLDLSLLEVERITKIKSAHLKALEEDRFEILPSETYVVGFLKKYCSILGLNRKKVISDFKKRKSELENIKKKKEQKKIYPEEVRINSYFVTPRLLTGLVIFAVISVISFYLFKQVSLFASAPKLDLSSPEKLEFISKEDMVLLSGETDPRAEVTISGQEVPTSESGEFSQKISLRKGANLVEIKAKNKSNKVTSKILKIIVE